MDTLERFQLLSKPVTGRFYLREEFRTVWSNRLRTRWQLPAFPALSGWKVICLGSDMEYGGPDCPLPVHRLSGWFLPTGAPLP